MRKRIFFYLSLLLCALVLKPLALPVLVGVVFAYVSEKPLYGALERFKYRSKLASWIGAVAWVFVVLALFMVPVITAIYVGIVDLVKFVEENDTKFSLPQILERGAQWLSVKSQDFGIPFEIQQIIDRMNAAIGDLSKTLLSSLGDLVSETPAALFALFIVLCTWVVFLVEGRRFREILLPKLIPWDDQRMTVSHTMGDVLRGLFVSNILVSLVQALIAMIFLGVFGIPKFFMWGVLTFFVSFVPVVGTAPVFAGAFFYCASNGRMTSGIFLIGGFVLVATIDNILRPYFMKGSVELNFFWVLLAFLGGVAEFGIAGLVIGPFAFALFIAALKELNHYLLWRKKVEAKAGKSPRTDPAQFE